ncbi:hypothetical protein P3T76_012335 [Phytophthora citrophthora]|uniref:Uncharacterized protein n=1 Tax=Phytophthora citrophthora TaxID=4793 RepID=A0AAD9G5Q8_9STRA|nr:hypothetical protein P3T76_012335 [Phytophthora citrophthora]
MECKSALKMRWTAPEVMMLTDEWAKVCVDPNTSKLRGDDLNKVIFERYTSRCVQMRQARRSPPAVLTQCDRMFHFARFVFDYDSEEVTQGRSSWFQLSDKQRREIEIPKEWRRQVAVFSPNTFSSFKHIIIPHSGGVMSKKSKKWSSKNKKVTSQTTGKQQRVVKIQPGWSTKEKVRLVQRWTNFMKEKDLSLENFETMTYKESCKSLASSTPPRSPFAAWRKARTLLTAWRFITAFNKEHQPGWFELTEVERDSKIKWEELPNKFEDIEDEVFRAMNKAVLTDLDKSKTQSPSVEQAALSPPEIALPLPFEHNLLLTNSSTSSEQLDRLLLEDNVASSSELLKPNGCVLETSSDCKSTPDGRSLSAQRLIEDVAIEPAVDSSQPLEPLPIFPSETIVDELQVVQETNRSQVLQAVGQLQEALDQGTKHTMESIRALKLNLLSRGNSGQLKHLELVLEQQKNRMLSVLRLAEVTSRQHNDEIQSLTENVLGNEVKAPQNGSAVVFV